MFCETVSTFSSFQWVHVEICRASIMTRFDRFLLKRWRNPRNKCPKIILLLSDKTLAIEGSYWIIRKGITVSSGQRHALVVRAGQSPAGFLSSPGMWPHFPFQYCFYERCAAAVLTLHWAFILFISSRLSFSWKLIAGLLFPAVIVRHRHPAGCMNLNFWSLLRFLEK